MPEQKRKGQHPANATAYTTTTIASNHNAIAFGHNAQSLKSWCLSSARPNAHCLQPQPPHHENARYNVIDPKKL